MTMSPAATLSIEPIEVGRVIEAYGVKGGIKLQPFSSSADGLLRVKVWTLRAANGTQRSITVDSAKWHGDVVTATLIGFTNRDQADALRGSTVWVNPALLPAPQAGEYYWRDLIGCQAVAADGRALGMVIELSDTGVHAVLHVDCGAAFEPCLIPFVNEYVGAIDLTAKTVQTQWQWDWLDAVQEKPAKPTRTKAGPKSGKAQAEASSTIEPAIPPAAAHTAG
jgi:16S rRNA processing protein RimM